MQHNRADCNGGMGIKSIVSGIVARHNWAAGNGDDVGCMGVFCRVAAAFHGCGPSER